MQICRKFSHFKISILGANMSPKAEMLMDSSPVVIIALTEVSDWTVPSKILFSFPWNPYLKTDGTSLLTIFLVKNFEEKEIKFLKERICQKLPSNDDNNWASECLNCTSFKTKISEIIDVRKAIQVHGSSLGKKTCQVTHFDEIFCFFDVRTRPEVSS